MLLSTFPYRNDLHGFFQLLSNIISNLEQTYQLTAKGGGSTSQARDIWEYWEEPISDTNMNYGRYLATQKTAAKTPIDFWLGLDVTRIRLRFIIWFKKYPASLTGIPCSNMQTLNAAFCKGPPLNHAEKAEDSTAEYWITMKDPDFTKFCDNALKSNLSHELDEFIEDVLKKL